MYENHNENEMLKNRGNRNLQTNYSTKVYSINFKTTRKESIIKLLLFKTDTYTITFHNRIIIMEIENFENSYYFFLWSVLYFASVTASGTDRQLVLIANYLQTRATSTFHYTHNTPEYH